MRSSKLLTRISQVEKAYYKSFYSEFIKELPKIYKKNPQRPIPFAYLRFWFSHRKIGWLVGRAVVNFWVVVGSCSRKSSHGIVLKEV